jgi:predicted Rossmann fold nucleotide-binding protein DprA/Smf involved in DNA uptake
MEPPPLVITPQHAHWPHQLDARLGETAPPELHALGDPALLAAPLTALFCSARCPGEAILRAYDQAAHWRDTGRAVIGGFHSPMEKECLRILLRGPQPIILCPARGLPRRLPPELHPPLFAGRMLILSPFPDSEVRVTRELAERRNLLVAALAGEVWFAHISPDGQMAELAKHVEAWRNRSTP